MTAATTPHLPLFAVLVGCNQVFGVDPTSLVVPVDAVEVDRDHDGLLDVIDNCPDVENPLQENQDGDDLGDACDPCVRGANSDEDADGLLDGCDNCPQLSNVDQANADADDLGDICDPDDTVQHMRAHFEGFAEPLSLLWIPEVAVWEAGDGTLRATMEPQYYEIGLWSRFIEVFGSAWIIETAVTVEETPEVQHAGLYTRTREGSVDHACYLDRTASGWTLYQAINPVPGQPGMTTSTPLASLPPTPIRLRLRKTADSVLCEIPGVATLSFSSVDSRTGAGFYVSTTTPRFHYIEAVGSPN